MLGLELRDGLHDDGQLVVERLGLLQHGRVLRVLQEGSEARLQRVRNGHAHIVDARGRILVELLVDADRVGQLDGGKGLQVEGDVVLEVRDYAGVSAQDLLNNVSDSSVLVG